MRGHSRGDSTSSVHLNSPSPSLSCIITDMVRRADGQPGAAAADAAADAAGAGGRQSEEGGGGGTHRDLGGVQRRVQQVRVRQRVGPVRQGGGSRVVVPHVAGARTVEAAHLCRKEGEGVRRGGRHKH